MTLRFLNGMEPLYPQVRDPVPPWDLNLVLSKLTVPPFKPLASCSLLLLSWKVSFLIAITSAQRVSEIRALMSEPPYTMFYKDKVQVRPHTAFLLKVSQFHNNQDIFLQVFPPKPRKSGEERRLHTLDVR